MSEMDIIEALEDEEEEETEEATADFEEDLSTKDAPANEEEDDDDGGSSGEDVDNWVGGKGDKGGDGGGKAVDYAEDAVMLQMEDDEIEAEAADDAEESSGPSGDDDTDDEIEAEYHMMANGVDAEFLGFEYANTEESSFVNTQRHSTYTTSSQKLKMDEIVKKILHPLSIKRMLKIIEISATIEHKEVREKAEEFLRRLPFQIFRRVFFKQNLAQRARLMNLRNFRNPRIYAVAHRQDQDGIFLLTSSTEKIGWTQISKISSKRMTSKHYSISSRVWGNFLLLSRPHKKGLIFDPYTGRAWPLQKTSCEHVACSSSVTDRDIICAGIPGPSVCLFDFHENSWLSTEHHLPQNPTASFSFKNQSYLLVFRGDFFDLVHVVSTVTKRLNTFPSPLRYKKQFKITNIEQIKVIQDAETSNRSAKIQVIYDTLKPAKNSSHMVHFSATLEFDGTKPFTTLLTLDMENYRLMEFTHFHPDTRQLDVRFKKSLEWPLWKRLPVLKNPILKRNQLFALSSSFCRKNVDGLDVMTIQDRFGDFDISSIGIFYQK